MFCMDCQTVDLAYATCLDPVHHVNFRRYGSTDCANFCHRIHKEAEKIVTSVNSNKEVQRQTVRA